MWTKEKQRTYAAQWYQDNKEKVRARSKTYREANPESTKEYRKANSERASIGQRARTANRDAGEYGCADKLSTLDIETLIADSPMLCVYCSDPMLTVAWQIDHVISMSQGGSNTLENIVICCRSCNIRKGAGSVLEFLTKKGN